MRSIRLLFGTYNHQPDGAPPEQFETAYQQAYKPFLSLLYKFPRICTVLHYCGSLFEWIEDKHPEFIMLLKEMIRRKQVELLGGGYHAPVLPLLPDRDKLGQIEKMNTFIRTTFGTRPRGSWITERVWEPSLARILSNSGIEYTFLDDHHFHVAGVEQAGCYQPYLTEDQGKAITVFPLNLALQEMVPSASPEQLIQELHAAAGPGGEKTTAVLVPGEELAEARSPAEGGTPGRGAGRPAAIYPEGGWLPRFFNLVEQNREWLHLINPRYAPDALHPRGRLYFPCLSSMETMNGALSPHRQRACQEMTKKVRKPEGGVYLQRGFFRQFLTRYPEVSLLYSRLMYTHLLVNQIRGDKYKKLAALNELWRGQTGAVYWNSRRGGAYSSCLRKAAYRAFIEAERITRNASMFMPSIIATDYDMDGQEEYLYQGKVLNAFVHKRGAVVLELDYLPKSWNYFDTMARWPERYHRYKCEGCDWYMRKGFIDHFFAPNTTLEKFDRMAYQEMGDFIDQPFELQDFKREQRKVVLRRQGQVRIKRKTTTLTLSKSYRFKENGIELGLVILNSGSAEAELWYGLEVNLALAGHEDVELAVRSGDAETEIGTEATDLEAIIGVQVSDKANGVQINLAADREFSLWSLPVRTVSYEQNERRSTYQSSCFVPKWELRLQPNERDELKVQIDLRKR
jgi:alpha-amylase